MNDVIRLGKPAIPVKITCAGTCLAKLEHIWREARRYARRNGYKIVETYGVVAWRRSEDMLWGRGSRI